MDMPILLRRCLKERQAPLRGKLLYGRARDLALRVLVPEV